MKDNGNLIWVLLIVGLLVFGGGKGCALVGPDKATTATYVYEKDTTAIPTGVETAFDKLNRKGIVATIFEQDTLDGNGKTPALCVVPLAAAKEAGLPAMVATNGAKVLKVVKNPQTEAAVLEAVP